MTTSADLTSELVVRIDEVEPGDLLLVTPRPHEPLGKMITRLDGSGFSHSAIALGQGRAASARTWTFGDGADLGGVRFDRIEHFWARKQSVYRLAVHSNVARQPALDRLRQLARPGEGDFSVPKIFLVAIALTSWDPGLEPEAGLAVRRLALGVARAFEQVPEDRSFFCAELVAHAYGQTFHTSALAPRNPTPAPPAHRGMLGSVLERIASALTDERARPAMNRLLKEVGMTLPTFLDTAARDILRSPFSGYFPRPGAEGQQGRLVPDKQEFDDAEVLPRALVTPRMLLDASWTAGHTQRIVGKDAPDPPDDDDRRRPARTLSP